MVQSKDGQRAAACLVCGGPNMARAHLFPRAAMHKIRRDAKRLIGIQRGSSRIGFSQSGEVSTRILCHLHEKSTQLPDDAIMRLLRAFETHAEPVHQGEAWQIANPRGALVGLFIHATVWRHWAAWQEDGRGPEFCEQTFVRLKEIVFEGAPQLPTAIIHAGRTIAGEPALMAITPTEVVLGGRNVVRFEMGGFAFFLWADDPCPPLWTGLQATADPLTIGQLSAGEVAHDQAFTDLMRPLPP